MLRNLVALTIEVNDKCQLTKEHLECPRNADRFNHLLDKKPCSDEVFIQWLNYCINRMNFKGSILLHYYNEPLLSLDRILRIMKEVDGNFELWTNGIAFINGNVSLDVITMFNKVMITVYEGYEEIINMTKGKYNNLELRTGSLDNRIIENIDVSNINWSSVSCKKITKELIVDYYGNVHMCCSDWRNEVKIGNIKGDGFSFLIEKWVEWKNKLSVPWDSSVPNVCKICSQRTPKMLEG